MPAGNRRAPGAASATLSSVHVMPPCHASRNTRLLPAPLTHTVSRQSPPERARPSHAGSVFCHTTAPFTGSIRIRPLGP